MISLLLFLLHLADLQILCPVFTLSYLRSNKYPFFYFSTNLNHCLDEILCESKFDVSQLINGVFTTFLCPGISIVIQAAVFGCFCACYPTHTESNKRFVAKPQARQESHKCSKYIFRTGSFLKVFLCFHRTLSC